MISKLLVKISRSAVIRLAFSIISLITFDLSYGQQSLSYAPYDANQMSTIISGPSGDLLKSSGVFVGGRNGDTTINLPVIGTGAVTLTVFFDYNCPYSRELLWVLNQYISGTSPNFSTTNNTKIIYRPVDYGFSSQGVALAVLFAKNLAPVNFFNVNNEIKKRSLDTAAVAGDRVNFNRSLDISDVVNTIFPVIPVNGLTLTSTGGVNVATGSQPAFNNANTELSKNTSDFAALPFPAGLNSTYKGALPVIIISNPKTNKMIYFIGTDKTSLDQSIAAAST